jgi:hypothetical protein
MKEKLVGIIPTPSEYGSYVTLLQQIGSQMDILQLEDNTRRQKHQQRQQPHDIKPDSMDWEPTAIRTSRVGLGPKERGRARWLSPEEFKKRLDKGSCLRCGKDGHHAKDCLLLPARRLDVIRSSKVSTKHIIRQQEEEEEYDDDNDNNNNDEEERGGRYLSTQQEKE